MSEKSSQKSNPRSELRDIVRKMGLSVAPHLPDYLKIEVVTRMLNARSPKEFTEGTVRSWWHALPDDDRGVDSRHMDQARQTGLPYIVANDNSRRLPCRSNLIALAHSRAA